MAGVKRISIVFALGALAALGTFSASAVAGSTSHKDTTTTTTTTTATTGTTTTAGGTTTAGTTTAGTTTTSTTPTVTVTTVVTTTVPAPTTTATTTTQSTTTSTTPTTPQTPCLGSGQDVPPWLYRLLLYLIMHNHRHHHHGYTTLHRADCVSGVPGGSWNIWSSMGGADQPSGQTTTTTSFPGNQGHGRRHYR
jgi:hypothetical protein